MAYALALIWYGIHTLLSLLFRFILLVMDEITTEVNTPRLLAAKARQKYYLGNDCPQAHGGMRYTSSGQCIECTKKRMAARASLISRLLKGDAA